MSTYLLPYSSGTVATTSGSAVVTGTLTAWLSQVQPGDNFRIGAASAIVASVDSNTQLTLMTTWTTTATGQSYAIDRWSQGHSAPGTLALRNSQLLESLGTGYTMQSPTSLAIGVGSKTFDVAAGVPILPGARMLAASRANLANAMWGTVTSYSGTTLVLNVETVSGSGTFADWNINIAGGTTQGTPGELVRSGAVTVGRPAAWVSSTLLGDIGYTPREVLSANRTYYVATSGSDSNDGLTAGTPLLTLQAAYNKVSALDLNSKSVTISVAAGTYSAGIAATAPVVGFGFISITGAGATTVISSGAAAAFSASGGAAFTISNLKVSAATGNCIYAINNGYVGILGGITFGASTQPHMRSDRGGTISLAYLATVAIDGGASAHIFANGGDVIASAPVYTLTGTPNFSTFANANGFGYVAYWTGSFTGAATGVRYTSSANSVINVFGAGVNYFPGSAAGNTSLGGQYV